MLYLYYIYIFIFKYTYIYQASNHHYKNYLPVIKRDLPSSAPKGNDRPGGRSREAYGGGRCAADGGCQR